MYLVLTQVNVAIAVATLCFLLNGLSRITKHIQGLEDLQKNEKVMCYQVIGFGVFCANYILVDIFSIVSFFCGEEYPSYKYWWQRAIDFSLPLSGLLSETLLYLVMLKNKESLFELKRI
jgi:hypothetical protein